MERGQAPESAIASWSAKFSPRISHSRDRHHFLAFTNLMVQVCSLLIAHYPLFPPHVQTDFCFEFLADLGPEGARISKVNFPFFCILCGYFPVVVELDGNRKSTFSLAGLDFGQNSCCHLISAWHFTPGSHRLNGICQCEHQ